MLALPQGSGFDLSAYLVPIVAFVVAADRAGLRRLALAPRPAGRAAASGRPPAAGPSGEDAERLDADLARYDL